jgi:hypothetical protein
MDPASAHALAARLLAEPLPDLWRHCQAVVRKVEDLRGLLGEHTELVQASGWLHEIGYAPGLGAAGFPRWTGRATYET